MRANLQPQFFPECLALLEALEELFEDADHNRIDADAFVFGPLFELESSFSSDVEKLRIGKLHAGLAGLHDVSHQSAHTPDRKPPQREIAETPKQEKSQGMDIGLSL